jgi:hypothetical protein
MQARQMLIEGEIHPQDWAQVARFVALVSQAEGVKYSPEILAEHQQKFVREFTARVKGEKVESDEEVKEEGEESHLEKFIMENYVEHLMHPENDTEIPEDFFMMVAREHQRINSMTISSAKYWLLEEFATLKKFGEETFEGTLTSETISGAKSPQTKNGPIQISVSPHGLNIRRTSCDETFSIPFSAVESAKSLRRCFHLCYLDEDFAVSNLVVKFSSHRIAGTLYRSLTEKHAFYSCETVHKNVETQFIRDLKVRAKSHYQN